MAATTYLSTAPTRVDYTIVRGDSFSLTITLSGAGVSSVLSAEIAIRRPSDNAIVFQVAETFGGGEAVFDSSGLPTSFKIDVNQSVTDDNGVNWDDVITGVHSYTIKAQGTVTGPGASSDLTLQRGLITIVRRDTGTVLGSDGLQEYVVVPASLLKGAGPIL